ncbi:hypothetical protein GCM10010345_32320 [Streptomyces canarius]|uniref:Uncharacterized protein n=1 Tax=Streptomyces canarius TaxID=285453 RepID=A0ABQ3CQV9_9ACTN|nr:hypothetical protein GCM10010345_32320 [Streptomyces canarius]
MNRSACITRLRSLAVTVASERLETALPAVTAAALTAGGAAWLAGDEELADLFWGLGTLAAVLPVRAACGTTVRSAWSHSRISRPGSTSHSASTVPGGKCLVSIRSRRRDSSARPTPSSRRDGSPTAMTACVWRRS